MNTLTIKEWLIETFNTFLNPTKDAKKALKQAIDEREKLYDSFRLYYTNGNKIFKATFLDLNLNTKTYTKAVEGMENRIVSNKYDIKYKFEKPFQKYLKQINFKDNHVIFNKSKKGTCADIHYHKEEEMMIVMGKMQVQLYSVNGMVLQKEVILSSGESIHIPRFIPHSCQFLEDSIVLLTLSK